MTTSWGLGGSHPYTPERRTAFLDECLDTLAGAIPTTNTQQVVVRHDGFAVTVEEVTARQERYAWLLTAAHPSTALMARRQVRRVLDAGLLRPEVLLDVSHDVLTRPEKVAVRHHLGLLRDAVTSGLVGPAQVADVLVAVLDPERNDVTVAVARVLAQCATQLREPQRERLRVEVGAAVPGSWDDLRAALGPLAPAIEATTAGRGETGQPSSSAVLPVDLPEPGRFVPVPNVDELTELLAHVLEEKASSIEVERALDGMARLRGPRPSVATALAARASRAWSRNGTGCVVSAWLGERVRPALHGVERREWAWDDEELPAGAYAVERMVGQRWAPAGDGAPMQSTTGTGRHYRFVDRIVTPQVLLQLRMSELWTTHVRSAPGFLLSTPTSEAGTLTAEALVERIGQRQAAGLPLLRHDVGTALLRLEPDDRAALAREPGLGSTLRSWLDMVGRPQLWTRSPTPRRGGTWEAGSPLYPDVLMWQPTNPPDGAPDDPVAGWLDTRSVSVSWHDYPRHLGTQTGGPAAALGMWALTLPSHPDVLATHLQPVLVDSLESKDADLSVAIGALGRSRQPLGAPALHALLWAAAGLHPMTRAAAAEAVALASRHGMLDGTQLGAQLRDVLCVDAAFLDEDSRPLVPKLSRVAATLADASGLSPQAGLAVLAALREVLDVVPDLHGGVALLELAAQLAERHGVAVDLPPRLAATARGRSTSRTAQEARRLAAAGRG